MLRAAELAGVYVPSLCSHKELHAVRRLPPVHGRDRRERGGIRWPAARWSLTAWRSRPTPPPCARCAARSCSSSSRSTPSSCLLCDEAEECRRSQTTIRKAGRLDRLPELPQRRRLRAAAGGGAGRDRRDRLPRRLPRARGRARRPLLRPRLQPLHPLRALRAHVRRGARRRGARVQVPRPHDAHRPRLRHLARARPAASSAAPACRSAPRARSPTRSPSGTAVPTESRPRPARSAASAAGVEVAHKGGALSFVRAAHDAEINDGQLCVRGRFCLPEATHHYARARKPMVRRGAYFRVADWDEALDVAAAGLCRGRPRRAAACSSRAIWRTRASTPPSASSRSGLGSSRHRFDGARLACPAAPPSGRASSPCPSRCEALARGRCGDRRRPRHALLLLGGRRADPAGHAPGGEARGGGRPRVEPRAGGRPLAAATPRREARGARRTASLLGGEPVARAGRGAAAAGSLAAAVRHDGDAALAVVVGPRVFDCPGADELLCRARGARRAPRAPRSCLWPTAPTSAGRWSSGRSAEVLPGPGRLGPPTGLRPPASTSPTCVPGGGPGCSTWSARRPSPPGPSAIS